MSKVTIENIDDEHIEKYTEIFSALIKSGGLTGVKSGKTILHFDKDGLFMSVELQYMPWRRRA